GWSCATSTPSCRKSFAARRGRGSATSPTRRRRCSGCDAPGAPAAVQPCTDSIAYYKLAYYFSCVENFMRHPNSRELAFAINDVARLLRTYADHAASRYGMTRAKWAVLARLDRFEGLKQAELAEMLDLQPITLTRLLDGLAENGLIERRPDPGDRRAKRLFLTPAARPLLE